MTTIIRSRPALAALSVLALAVAACGGDDDESGDDAGSDDAPAEQDESSESDDAGDSDDSGDATGSSNVYSAELEDGSVLTVTLDVEETDPVVAPFVAFREQAGATDDVVWITGSLEAPADYDDPTGPPTGRFLTFIAPGGDRLDESNPTSDFACGQLQDWFGEPTAEEGLALNEAYLEILDTSCGGQVLGVVGEVGATTEYAMVVEGSSLPDFESIYAGLLTELQPV